MAQTPLKGAGISGKSNLENSPGLSGMANIMLWDFHCSLSSTPNSLHTSQAPSKCFICLLLQEIPKA